MDREDALSFMAGLCAAVGDYRAAEVYILELLALVAFSHMVDDEDECVCGCCEIEEVVVH